MSLITGVSTTEKLIFTKHLATMMKAGIPVAEALDLLIEQTTSPALKKIISLVLADVKNGQSLSDSFAEHPRVFDELYVSLVEIGEESGTLDESLQFLAAQIGSDLQLRKKIQGALLYPGLVLVATAIMGGLISFFVLPQLVDFLRALEVELPLSTQILLIVATAMRDFGVLIVAGVVGGIVGLYTLLHLPATEQHWDAWKLSLPLFGRMMAYGQYARFARNLGVLLKSGVPASRSLEIVAATVSNKKLQADIHVVNAALEKGGSIGAAMSDEQLVFPSLIAKMVAVGEKSGNLDETMLYLGEFYEEELDTISKNLTTVLEPFLLLVIGLVVGFVALAIISPIYGLTGSIRR